MSRWPVPVWLPILFAALGCASSPTVLTGLANAPPLGGGATVVEGPQGVQGQEDVVSNGQQSCEAVTGRSPLRGHLPPCPTVWAPAPVVPPMSVVAAKPGSLVVPWLEHFYAGFPCRHGSVGLESATVASAGATCSLSDGSR